MNQSKETKKALLPVNDIIKKGQFIIGPLSGVDFMLGHSLFMSNKLGCVDKELHNIHSYLEILNSREPFQTAVNT